MRRLLLLICILLLIASASFAAEKSKTNPRDMKFSPLSYNIPKALRVMLNCGMPVYLLQDKELPIVNISAMVHAGSLYEPAAKAGLAAMTGSVMRSGGSGGIMPDHIDDELAFMASNVDSAITADSGVVTMTSLTKNFSRTLLIFRNTLLSPDFNEKRVELARRQMIEGLRRENDNPKDLAARELGRAIYAGHPLGVTTTVETVKAVTREDLLDFHRRFFRVDNMILTVSGDFEPSEMIKELNAVFPAKPPLDPLLMPELSQPKADSKAEIFYGKKDVSQTVIRMGHLGIRKDNPDLYAIRVLDYLLGGSFTSRLTMEIRTNHGLAYNVGSHFDVGRLFSGTFVAETETRADATAKVIDMLIKIISGMQKEAITERELQGAKEFISNSFMFGFTNPATIVNQRARLEFYGYPADYLEKYRDNVAKVTKEDVLAAARKYLQPEAFKLVVIGDGEKFDKPLETFGKVTEIEFSTKSLK